MRKDRVYIGMMRQKRWRVKGGWGRRKEEGEWVV